MRASRDEARERVNRLFAPRSDIKRETKNGSLHWSRLQALSSRGDEALPQGRALLHREVLVHAPALPARAARPSAREAQRVRDSPPREAEGPPHLWGSGASVPEVLLRRR